MAGVRAEGDRFGVQLCHLWLLCLCVHVRRPYARPRERRRLWAGTGAGECGRYRKGGRARRRGRRCECRECSSLRRLDRVHRSRTLADLGCEMVGPGVRCPTGGDQLEARRGGGRRRLFTLRLIVLAHLSLVVGEAEVGARVVPALLNEFPVICAGSQLGRVKGAELDMATLRDWQGVGWGRALRRAPSGLRLALFLHSPSAEAHRARDVLDAYSRLKLATAEAVHATIRVQAFAVAASGQCLGACGCIHGGSACIAGSIGVCGRCSRRFRGCRGRGCGEALRLPAQEKYKLIVGYPV
mmetsp:Transcript_7650/g.31062  ORF Transcript_7650/g.31062 Transcript_7650/m.31062 type:complete len:298 (+) Transcript_7650:404-1297(+)